MKSRDIQNEASFYLADLYVCPSKSLIQLSDGPRTIQPKLMEVLCYLAARRGQVISADALVEACWPRQYISDSPVHKCIAQLRKILGDTSKASKYIKTVPKKGYMVVAKVTGLEGVSSSGSEPFWTEASPYPGTKPFTQNDQEVFFGRRQVVKGLVEKAVALLGSKADGAGGLARPPAWLSLHGPSGCGKTSLVQAGLLPQLTRHSLLDSEGANYSHLDLATLSDQPAYQALLAHLYEQEMLPPDMPLKDYIHLVENAAEAQPGSPELLAYLQRGLLRYNNKSSAVIFIDHLEAAYSDDGGQNAAHLSAILDALVASGKCFLITAVDRDCLPQIEVSSQYFSKACQCRIPKFSKSEIARIIQKPAIAAGLTFEYKETNRERLDTFLIHQQQINPAPLCILQDLMSRLYVQRDNNVLTYAAYENIGGVGGCFAELAEQAYQGLGDEHKPVFYDQLFYFVELNNEGNAVVLADPVALQGFHAAVRHNIISPLLDAGILRASRSGDAQGVRLAHESLLDHWPRLQKWVSKNISGFYLRHDISVATKRWLAHQKHTDFLLESRQSVKQAKGLKAQGNFGLSDDELMFVQRSAKKSSLRSTIKVSIAASFMAAALALGWLTVSLQQSSDQLFHSRNNAENLISVILNDFKEELQPLGKLELLQIVGSKAKDYFDAAGTQNLSPTSLIQWTEALNIMGQVDLDKLAYDKAQAYFEQSKQALDEGLGKYPANVELLEQAMLTNYWLGNVFFRQKKYEAAEPFVQNYLATANKLVVLQPEETKWQIEKSYALTNLGSLAEKNNQLQSAADFIGQSATIKNAILQIEPDNHNLRDSLANTLSWQATVMQKTGKLSTALGLRRRGVVEALALIQTSPDNYRWIRRIAILEHHLAALLFDMGNLVDSYSHSQSAQIYLNRLIANDPENGKDQERLFWSHLLLARVLRVQGQYDQSLMQLNMASQLGSEGDIGGQLKGPAILMKEQAQLYSEMGQKTSALFSIERALVLFNEKVISEDLGPAENLALHGELVLAKLNILSRFSQSIDDAFLKDVNVAQNGLLSVITADGAEPKHKALYQALAQHLGQVYQDSNVVISGVHLEYRNPDFAQGLGAEQF